MKGWREERGVAREGMEGGEGCSQGRGWREERGVAKEGMEAGDGCSQGSDGERRGCS